MMWMDISGPHLENACGGLASGGMCLNRTYTSYTLHPAARLGLRFSGCTGHGRAWQEARAMPSAPGFRAWGATGRERGRRAGAAHQTSSLEAISTRNHREKTNFYPVEIATGRGVSLLAYGKQQTTQSVISTSTATRSKYENSRLLSATHRGDDDIYRCSQEWHVARPRNNWPNLSLI